MTLKVCKTWRMVSTNERLWERLSKVRATSSPRSRNGSLGQSLWACLGWSTTRSTTVKPQFPDLEGCLWVLLDPESTGTSATVAESKRSVTFERDNGAFGETPVPKAGTFYFEAIFTLHGNCFAGIGVKGRVNLECNAGGGGGIVYSAAGCSKWRNGQFKTYGTVGKVDSEVIGVLVNLQIGKIAFFHNGVYQGVAFDNLESNCEYFPLVGAGNKTDIVLVDNLQFPTSVRLESSQQVVKKMSGRIFS